MTDVALMDQDQGSKVRRQILNKVVFSSSDPGNVKGMDAGFP